MSDEKNNEKKECCRDAWIAGVHAADKIFRDTVRQAFEEMSADDFIAWIKGYVGKEITLEAT